MFTNKNRFCLFTTKNLFLDIDQLTRILTLCGTPTDETLSKITSEEVELLLLGVYRLNKASPEGRLSGDGVAVFRRVYFCIIRLG